MNQSVMQLTQTQLHPLLPCLDAQFPVQLTSLYLEFCLQEFCLPARESCRIVRLLRLPLILEPTTILSAP